jgi:hypothetical protein
VFLFLLHPVLATSIQLIFFLLSFNFNIHRQQPWSEEKKHQQHLSLTKNIRRKKTGDETNYQSPSSLTHQRHCSMFKQVTIEKTDAVK